LPRIEPRQRDARLDLAHDPALEALLLDRGGDDVGDERGGMTTAPSPSRRSTSFGITATPPQPIGSCQPTKVSPLTDAGAAAPWHHTGRPWPARRRGRARRRR
jgi:hypothetical protein